MVWSEILIILSSALGASYIGGALNSKFKDVKYAFLFAQIAIIFFQINKFLAYSTSWIVSEILTLSIFAFLLVILLITIRYLKPEFARYPYLLLFLPIVIPSLYPLISGNVSIIQLVVQLLQIAAILSLFFILLSHIEDKRTILLTALSLILFTAAGLLYWFGESIQVGFWLWQTLTAIGIGLISYSFTNFYNFNPSINRYERK